MLKYQQHVSSSGQHCIGVQVVGTPWERIRSIPVDREGEFTFPLKPRTEKLVNRLLCEVKVIDNVKVVTIRSTYKIENHTLYPLEVTLVDDRGQPVHSLEKIVPGQDYAIPIDAVASHRIRIQPDRRSHSVCRNHVIEPRFFRGIRVQVVSCDPMGGPDFNKKLYCQMSS